LCFFRNKWVLNTTDAPLFFLFAQLLIAVVLFLATNAMGLIDIPIVLDVEVCKGLIPVVALNVVGLRYICVPSHALDPSIAESPSLNSFSNYTLKYVDASFYQVARGLVLPLTVCTSFLFLHTRPSIAILFSCSIVTLGFFIGVFFDGAQVSLLGVFFGVGSSMITAVHAVIIKKGLELVNGNAIHFSWYANLMSTVVLGPLVFLAGEGGAVYDLLFGEDTMGSGGFTAMRTFIWGSIIAVSTTLLH
jgi:solute carrier family 35 (GDP-fucose transporter), member C1